MEDLPISFLDIVILVTIGLSAIVGMVRGFVREVLALASWIGAGWVTLTFYPDALDYLQTMIETEVWAKVAAGGGLFILSLVVFTIIARLVAGTVQNSKLIGPLDRTMGLAFGVLRGALLLTLANIFVLKMVADDSERPDDRGFSG